MTGRTLVIGGDYEPDNPFAKQVIIRCNGGPSNGYIRQIAMHFNECQDGAPGQWAPPDYIADHGGEYHPRNWDAEAGVWEYGWSPDKIEGVGDA